MPAFLQVPIREYTIAARYAEASLPQKSQFFLPYVGIVRYIIVYQCVGLRGRIPMLAVDMNAHLIYRILINWSTGSHISIFIRLNVLINMELCKLFLTYFQ